MWKAPETLDDLAMGNGPFQAVLIAAGKAVGAKQFDGKGLIAGVLRMFKRQIEKGPQGRFHLLIITIGNGLACHGAGAAISGKGMGRVAIDVARYLVEQKDQT